MKVSIIVPVYNVECYIEECFNSVAAQTYTGEIECIFVDDCGQDCSINILENLISDYQGPILFFITHHERNKGLSCARNTGINTASGDFLFFLDSDDTISPTCIELLTALVEKYPDVNLVQGSTSCKINWMQLEGKGLPEYSDNQKWIKSTMLQRFVLPMTAWNKLLNRRFIINNKLYFEEGVVHEDEAWNFLLAKHVRSLATCCRKTYFYRDNEAGIMSQADKTNIRYYPVLEKMVKYVSGPSICEELICIKTLLGARCSRKELAHFVSLMPCNHSMVMLWYDLRAKKSITSESHIVGMLYRLLYRVHTQIMNIYYQ